MNQFTCDYRNLDDATRAYLESVARARGRGVPGVYIPGGTNAWPIISLILGGIILFFGLGWTLASPKAPWASALLLTATVLLGGWMVLYPFRRWFFGGLGTFQYFDPNTVYESNAGDVTVTDISDRTNIEFTENYNDGNYTGTTLHFHLPGKAFAATIKKRGQATVACDFYGNLFALANDPNYANLPPAEMGGTAKYIAISGSPPSDLKLLDLAVTELPMEPSTTKAGGGMALRYLMIVGGAAAIFVASWAFLSPVQDEIAFNEAKKHGVQGYRDYLLDEKNTSHRDEAKAKIKELYQPVIAKVDACPDANEKKAWKELLTGLSEFEGLPVVSVSVAANPANPTTEQAMRQWLADSLGSYFGPTYVVFVEPPQGSKPLVELKYNTVPNTSEFTWTMTYRKSHDTPDSEAVTTTLRRATGVVDNNRFGGVVVVTGSNSGYPPESFRTAFFQQTFATTAPAIFTQPILTGDSGE